MTPKVQKRAAAVVVHPRADETSVPGTGASGTVGGGRQDRPRDAAIPESLAGGIRLGFPV